MKQTELIAPAGNLKKLKYALTFGADAAYCGLPSFSLRQKVNQFDEKTLKLGIEYAHSLDKKVYATVNIFPLKNHLPAIEKHLRLLKKLSPDAIIISDPGVLSLAKKICPEIAVHLSTQANCTNWQAAKFWFDQGVKRIVLARETTLEDIKQIHEKVPQVELEYFVHGAMCMSYSGRCLLSKYFNDRSANLGDCTQPCRWKFKAQNSKSKASLKSKTQNFKQLLIREEKRPGELLKIEEDDGGSYVMNSKDLCLVEHLEELKDAGISAFKIEGRSKSIYYVGNVTKIYRDALDFQKNRISGELGQARLKYDLAELKKCQNREFTTGFLFGPENCEQKIDASHADCDWEFCGEIVAPAAAVGAQARIRVHNQMFVGDEIEFVAPNGKNIEYKIKKMFDEEMNEIREAHGGQGDCVFLPLGKELPRMTLLRRRVKSCIM